MAVGSDTSFAFLVGLALALTLFVAVNMFTDVQGGGQPVSSWIAWHAILMTLSFPGLMALGRFAYCSDCFAGKWDKRRAHLVLMVFAVLGAVLGYICVFQAHWPDRKFFGYDFKTHKWTSVSRIAHVYLGYGIILLSLVQAGMGAAKMQQLSFGEDRKILPVHGTIGKAIIIAGASNVSIAAYFWGWSLFAIIFIWSLCGLSVLFGAVWPRLGQGKDEGMPLVAPP